MPNYPGVLGATAPVTSNLSPIALQKGESVYVFGSLVAGSSQLPLSDGNVTTEIPGGSPQASIAVNLQPSEQNCPPMVTVELRFATTPGAAGSMAIQEADTDADAFYLTPTNATYTIDVSGGALVFRADFSPTGGKFMRLKYTKGANNVGLTAKITRLA